jgi:hypothetical protein
MTGYFAALERHRNVQAAIAKAPLDAMSGTHFYKFAAQNFSQVCVIKRGMCGVVEFNANRRPASAQSSLALSARCVGLQCHFFRPSTRF